MQVWSENLPENHVDLRHCTVTYRLKNPVGDRACLWIAADGHYHGIVGMQHEDILSQANEAEPWGGTLELINGPTILLKGNTAIRLDNHFWGNLPTPLGPIFYSSYSATFHWMLAGEIWSGELDGVDFFVRDYDPEKRVAEAGIEVINDYTNWREVEIDPFARQIRILERQR
ncbi:MAG: hypothetical protein QE269_07170 [Fimbriimonas sp.]|nr:hypothetical protein [Fimbriimonas sp.]